jgi:hypothetical protein
MASPVERLIAMRRELDDLIAEMQGGGAPGAPKKARGRPKVEKADLDAAAVAGGVAAEEIEKVAKPKRVLTEEQKAKMKAGREAAKARKGAEKDAAERVAAGMPPALGPMAAGPLHLDSD